MLFPNRVGEEARETACEVEWGLSGQQQILRSSSNVNHLQTKEAIRAWCFWSYISNLRERSQIIQSTGGILTKVKPISVNCRARNELVASLIHEP